MLKISSVSNDRWIWISSKHYDEPDEYVELVKAYQNKLAGKVFAIPKHDQHGIDNDPYKLRFQWDSNFGITIVVPIETNIKEVTVLLENLCDEINQAKNELDGK